MKARSLQQRVGEALRRRREALRITQEDFADSIDMHRTYYSAIERGEKNLTLTTLDRVCKGLDARPWEVMRDAAE